MQQQRQALSLQMKPTIHYICDKCAGCRDHYFVSAEPPLCTDKAPEIIVTTFPPPSPVDREPEDDDIYFM